MSDVSPSRSSNNLAYSYQEPLTAILRLRSQAQTVTDAEALRANMRRLLQSAMAEARSLGYTSQHIQMGILVTVGFLDETMLNLQSPVTAEWARRPLQEELFGGHMAGETVFTNINGLMQQQDSAEVADVLELHCHCIELGYKGRYAFGNGWDLRQLVQQCRDKIARTRGRKPLFASPLATNPPEPRRGDRVSRVLLIAAAVLALVTILAFAGYELSLASGITHLETSSLQQCPGSFTC